ncbi:MAG: alpha-amylase family glycosyl hydrolase, partial [Desulfovibrionales bacterium]
MQFPLATYRIQFTPDFGFSEAVAILPYLKNLGISDLYASPIFQARSGSMHGYDVCDHNKINNELGGEQTFAKLITEVRHHDMGWIQDIVPNHMAVSGSNPILVDVLENGPESLYYGFFDINWDHPDIGFQGRMLAPFLGSFFAEALENGEIKLVYDQHGFSFHYYELMFPVRLESYFKILTLDLNQLQSRMGKDHPDYIKLLGILYSIKSLATGGNREERYDQIFFLKRLLFEMHETSVPIRSYI